jgi:hypothetical protein
MDAYLYDVVVMQLFEQAHLSDGCGGDALIVILELDLLERDQLAIGCVARLVHVAVGALANLVQLRFATAVSFKANTINVMNLLCTAVASYAGGATPAPYRDYSWESIDGSPPLHASTHARRLSRRSVQKSLCRPFSLRGRARAFRTMAAPHTSSEHTDHPSAMREALWWWCTILHAGLWSALRQEGMRGSVRGMVVHDVWIGNVRVGALYLLIALHLSYPPASPAAPARSVCGACSVLHYTRRVGRRGKCSLLVPLVRHEPALKL